MKDINKRYLLITYQRADEMKKRLIGVDLFESNIHDINEALAQLILQESTKQHFIKIVYFRYAKELILEG